MTDAISFERGLIIYNEDGMIKQKLDGSNNISISLAYY